MAKAAGKTAGATRSSRRTKGEAARARILDITRRLLIDEGYDALVMRAVAAEAGMTLGNLQYYFPTREVLLEAVVRDEAVSDLEDLAAVCNDRLAPRDELAALARLLMTKWRGESGRISALLGFLALHQPAFRRIYREVYEQFYGALGTIVRRAAPHLSEEEVRRRARMVTALIDGASMQVSRGGSAAFLDDVVEAVWCVATAPAAESARTQEV